jgi:hypothetical protein
VITPETGALFRLSLELLALNSEASISDSTLESLSSVVSLLGQYFQIRDDYMNLIDNKVCSPEPISHLRVPEKEIHFSAPPPPEHLLSIHSTLIRKDFARTLMRGNTR